MKLKRLILIIPVITSITVGGCAAPLAALPGIVPSLIPSVDMSTINVNSNQISCYKGSWIFSDYCSIPISRFTSLTIPYATIDNASFLLLNINENHANQQFFNDVNSKEGLESLNAKFLKMYPEVSIFANLPKAEQSLYIKVRENYIPNKNYDKLYQSYIYLYTLNIMREALTPCESSDVFTSIQARHKVFAIQFTNDILYNISDSLSSKYTDEKELYNKLYAKILTLNPYKLERLAKSILNKTNNAYTDSLDHQSLTTIRGVGVGDLGRFSCNYHGSFWLKYDYNYFGDNTSGVDIRVKYKLNDDLNDMSSQKITDFDK